MKDRLNTQLLNCSVSNALHSLRTALKQPEFLGFFHTEKFYTVMNNIFVLNLFDLNKNWV